MKKEDIFEALEGVDESFIIHAGRKRKVSDHTGKTDLYFPVEKVIDMKVVERKKRISFALVVLIAVLAAGIAVMAALSGTKEDKIQKTERKITDYFRTNEDFSFDDRIKFISEIEGKDDVICMSAEIVSDMKPSELSVYDLETGASQKIDTSGYDGDIYKLSIGEKYLWIAQKNDDGKNQILRADRETLIIKDCTELEENETVVQIAEHENGRADVQLAVKDGQELTDWIVCSFDEEMKKTSEKSLVKEDAEENVLISCLFRNDSEDYYLIYEDPELNLIMYRYDNEGNEIYRKENISGDMEGITGGLFLTSEGDPVVMTNLVNFNENDTDMHHFNIIDKDTGEVKDRFENEMNQIYLYIFEDNYSFSDQYDITYTNESGKLYGYSVGDEMPAEILTDSSLNIKTACIRNNTVLINTAAEDTESAVKVVTTDLNGNITGEMKDKISVQKLHVYDDCIRILEGESSIKDKIVYNASGDYSYTVYTLDRECNVTDKVPLDIDNAYIIDFTVCSDGTIAVLSERDNYNHIALLGGDGKLIADKRTEGHAKGMFSCGENVYVFTREEKTELKQISAKDTELKTIQTLDIIPEYCSVKNGFEEYDAVFRLEDGIYGYKISDNSIHSILNWVDSDIYFSQLNYYSILNPDNIIYMAYDLDSDYSFRYLSRIAGDELEKIQNRKLITIASLNIVNEDLQKMAQEYNSSSDEFRISIEDYSKYRGSDLFSSHLDEAIIKGNIPDIVIGSNSINGVTCFDWQRYTNSGLFEDLRRYMDTDPEFNREDYFSNLFDAFAEGNAQYQIPVRFSVKCLTGKDSVLGDITGYTWSNFFETEKEDGLISSERRSNLVLNLIESNLSEYIDFSAGKCHFNRDDFVRLLEYIKDNGVDDETDCMTAREKDVPEGRCTFNLSDFTDFRGIAFDQQMYVGEDMAFLGYPSDSDSSCMAASEFIAAVCSSSSSKDEAWSIVKYLLSDKFQVNLQHYCREFPVKKSAFQITADSALRNHSSSVFSREDGTTVRLKNINKPTIERFTETVEKIHKSASVDSGVSRIIEEQTGIYFDGQLTASETAEAIQKKVSLYLKEIG